MGCSAPAPGSSGCRGSKEPTGAATLRHAQLPFPALIPELPCTEGATFCPLWRTSILRPASYPSGSGPLYLRREASDWELAKLAHGQGAELGPSLMPPPQDDLLSVDWGHPLHLCQSALAGRGENMGGAPGVLEAGDII